MAFISNIITHQFRQGYYVGIKRSILLQKLDISEGDIPITTTELVVSGAEELMLKQNAFTHLMDLRHVRISGAKLVVLRKGTAVNLNIINAYIEIEDCEVLRVEEKAFSNIRGECHGSYL